MRLLSIIMTALLVCLCWVAPLSADLIQHLDATVVDSVELGSNGVLQWKDISGNENHALANRGNVLYPSTSLAGGEVGLDVGFERNDLALFDQAGASALLDFQGAAAGNSGFTVLFSCRVDVIVDQDQNILGTRNTNGHFNFSLDGPSGEIRAKVATNINAGVNARAGDTLVLALSYEAATGATWLYESKTGSIINATKPANGDFDNNGIVMLGEAKPTANSNDFFRGAFGEVMVFNEYMDAESATELISEMVYKWVTPLEEKLKPAPLGLVDVDEQPLEGLALNWKPGLDSVDQRVYFGTDADAVANASPDNPMDVYMGTQPETTYPLPMLEYGTTYFWRIESVNGEIYSTDVLSFATMSYAYALDPDAITATASSTAGAEGLLDPNNTCNGAGLDPNNMHGTGSNSMWLSDNAQEGPVWIRYDFDALVKLNEILIWNYNSVGEQFYGHSVKDATIDYSIDGINWQHLTDLTLAQGPSAPEYDVDPSNRVPVSDLTVKAVRITALNNYSEILPNMFGLSEVQFLVVPLQAANPIPNNDQGGVLLDPALARMSWTPGRGALSHILYVDTDMDAVINETVPGIPTLDTMYEMPALLDVNTVYYWKVNEDTGDAIWAGNIWNYTTVATELLDDMESYTADENVNPIWAIYLDGFDDPENNGALVGADPNTDDYSPEISVVRSGRQSLPIWFDNTVAPISTVTRTFTADEIPAVGASAMILYYQFGSDSVGETLFVEINGIEVASVAIPATIVPQFAQLSIDLTLAGIDDATQMADMTIGIRGANAKGVVYVDDIMLTNL